MDDINLREMDDERMVAEAYQHLIDTYLASHHRKHTEIIDKAFNFAKEAHKGVRRLSGEPYIMHPIAPYCRSTNCLRRHRLGKHRHLLGSLA